MITIKPIEVKKEFVLARALKDLFEKGSYAAEESLKLYEELSKRYSEYDEEELNRIINGLELGKSINELEQNNEEYSQPQDRISRYSQLSWEKGPVSFYKMGAWPEMRGIPPEFTKGSIVETSSNIQRYSFGKNSYPFSKERKNSLQSLLEKIELVSKNPLIEELPLILVPGKSVRGEGYKKWVKENHKNYIPHNTNLFGVDEGNIRALALFLKGKTTTLCYVGK